MSEQAPPPRPARSTIAVVVLLVVGIVALIAVVNRVAGYNSPPGVNGATAASPGVTDTAGATPGVTDTSSPAATGTAAATPSGTPLPPVPPAVTPCDTASFGAALAPLNAPADVHVYNAAPAMTINVAKLYRMHITTVRGTLDLCLQPQLAPKTVNVIVTLARNHYYDGLAFHRVVPNFVIQGGDPKGDGTGGPGFTFADEPVKAAYAIGAVAMANSGADSNGSQFFIVTGTANPFSPKYNLFGHAMGSTVTIARTVKVGDAMSAVTVDAQQ